jgi:hypothetical protein
VGGRGREEIKNQKEQKALNKGDWLTTRYKQKGEPRIYIVFFFFL